MSTDVARIVHFLVTVGEGIGNMVETTPLLHALGVLGKVWVLAKPTTPGTEEILRNPTYVEQVWRFDTLPDRMVRPDFDYVVHTYSANTNKDPRFLEEFHDVGEILQFAEADAVWARLHGEALGNLRQVRKIQGWGIEKLQPRSWVNCRESDGVYDVVLGSGAYNESKVWPGFDDLKKRIKGEGLTFRDLSEETRLPLPDVAATIRDAGVFVGNDSGLAHIAAAVRTPAVILYGPTTIEKNLPYQSTFAIPLKVDSIDCSPCKYQKSDFERCRLKCWDGLVVDQVLAHTLYTLDNFYTKGGSR